MENVMTNGFAELSANEMGEIDGGIEVYIPIISPFGIKGDFKK